MSTTERVPLAVVLPGRREAPFDRGAWNRTQSTVAMRLVLVRG
jgi:hypothetical protein